MLNTIILAGSQSNDNWSGLNNKGLIPINGKIIIEYVIDALRKSNDIGKIVVVGPKKDLELPLKDKVDSIVDSNGSIVENLVKGIKHLHEDSYVLVCTSDIPLVTPEAIEDFVNKSKTSGADVCYPIVEKKVNILKYPEIERTYVRMKEGTFTGGNMFYVNPGIVEPALSFIEKLVNYRKDPVKMAKVFGVGFVFQLITGILTISRVEKKVSDLLGIKAKCIITEHPEIGNDIDKPSDVIAITAHLS
ncbi:MAG: nucleotidyltransferase family protein [Bacillota bacterium]